MSGRSFAAIVALMSALVIALAACGGGNGNSNSNATKTAAAGGIAGTAPSPASTPSLASTPDAASTPGAGGTSAGGSDSGGDPEVKAIQQKFAGSTFRAEYNLSGGAGGDTTFTDGKMTLTKDGQTRFRFDVTGKQDGQDVAFIFIETSDNSAFCLKNAGAFGAIVGVPDGQGVCFKTDPQDSSNPIGSLAGALKDFENSNVTLLEKSGRNIAGQDATCYRTQDNQTSVISTTCFNGDGVILYVNDEGSDGSTIEATGVSKAVNQDDFNLPYEVRDLPNITGDSTAIAGDATNTP